MEIKTLPVNNKKILYIQYTNPAAYPPLEHSSRILADRGWEVLFLGTGAYAANEMVFKNHPRILIKKMEFCSSGIKQKFHYACYGLWCLFLVLRWKPRWIYASDPLICPIAWLLIPLVGGRVIYHEHDSPSPTSEKKAWFQRISRKFRQQLGRKAAIGVLPNQERLENFLQETGRMKTTLCVWNCPEAREVQPPLAPTPNQSKLKVVYHGSINPLRFPKTIIQAMAFLKDRVELTVIGYETVGYPGYMKQIFEFAEEKKISGNINWVGVLPRKSVLPKSADSSIGLSLMPIESDDINLRHMVGASNKPFDYMASGLALLVSDLTDWKEMYVRPGYGLACNPGDPQSIMGALQWFLEHPEKTRAMGEAGRNKILTDYNYEKQFSPVLELLENRMGLE